ncbi:MAG: glycosyltransferase [Euryarchaeota archaeon]|nr:glycosyltransferase [Euryarchaeota archaeon]MCG2734890.1 glycosyltransferase [Candidatus Methanoperedenaceae archaeon]
MKFSVLLPTRNGGRFLANCMSSILKQPYHDMELVVSDNANIDETQAVIASFAEDSRLKVIRTDKPISVTDNWNNALHASSGDYILMIGDDDYLLPGYFHRIEQILEKYGNPECITYNAYTYVAPDSINGNTRSYYKKSHFEFGSDFENKGLISSEMRSAIVRDMYRFQVRIPLNMQTTLMSRQAINKISEGIFQPPFPDHYALNALLLNAKVWAYVPENLLVVGVSPKSFGHFVYSNQQDKGQAYLGIASNFKNRLPGNELINNMHVWLTLLKSNYKNHLDGIEINRAGYVRRQVYSWYLQYKFGTISLRDLLIMTRKLSTGDWLGLFSSIVDKASWLRLWRILRYSKNNKMQNLWYGLHPLDNISNIEEFASWISSQSSVRKR